MTNNEFTVLDLLEIDTKDNSLELKCVAGRNGLDNMINNSNINRPGLALGGYFDRFAFDRIQVFGNGESYFIKNTKYKDELSNLKKFMEYKIPCVLFSSNNMPPDFFMELADQNKIPILISNKNSDYLVSKLFHILSDVFAKKKRVHGVFLEVFGIGILIQGKSGVGKSEIALELIQRGHRLVADDSVDIKVIQESTLIGEGAGTISHHMEITGIGIIDVMNLFGVGAVRDQKQVQLVVELENYDSTHEYDTIGLEEKFVEILDVKIPFLLIPILPGRNIPIIIEIAAMNQRLKLMGINSAKEFTRNLMKHLQTEEIKRNFFNFQ
ncbi:MAG: HPr kinase/phosphorylase [Spirochaetes bacterium]|nr:HPr kinase/phosphorylase [Spirochaetota bacterium]